MNIHPDDEAFLARFQTLPKPRRQAIYRGLLERLRSDEWREVREHAEVHTLQCDIFGKLPLEITSLVAGFLPLVDMIRLRRVSRRWQSILSYHSLCRAALWKALGRNPLVNSTAPVSNTLTATSKTDSNHDFETSFASFVERRYRLERGKPHSVISMRSPAVSQNDHDYSLNSVDFRYSNGICTWIDQLEDGTSVIALNLSTGERKKFTTANRETLLCVRISGSTIAALSLSGYCHVWNYDDTSQCSSFRVPSLEVNQILIRGKSVVLEYPGSLVHWSCDTRIARTIDVEQTVVTVALHPSEDEITTIHYCEQLRSEPERTLDGDGDDVLTSHKPPMPHFYTTKYALNSEGDWYASPSRPVPIPIPRGPMDWPGHYVFGTRKEIQPGQYGIDGYIEYTEEEDENGHKRPLFVYLSIEPNGLVAMHTLPYNPVYGPQFYSEEGIIYFSIAPRDGKCQQYGIAKSKAMTGPSDAYVWLDYSIQHLQDVEERVHIFGDEKFLVFLGKSKMDIWVMDENAMDEMTSARLPGLVALETV
ncbi:hypothetical protein PEBR_23918 [Penicillium brasilianum]|uniref:F-box domain-containing protein n=1 Tax=Penicillium brasilianum TaxID=104259 RepID=A0A1S9RJV0_PENBI|nr:hypothetical protein PEBR_23918 [Penicillium brasilianum]